MDTLLLQKFAEYLVKTAGVELNLHGYHREPNFEGDAVAEKQWDTAYEKARKQKMRELGPEPPRYVPQGLLDHFLKKPRAENPELPAYHRAVHALAREVAGEPPQDPFEYRTDSRIRTPHERHIIGKLTANLLGASPMPDMEKHDTDLNYSDEPYENRLDRAGVERVLQHYKGLAQHSPEDQKYHDAFEAHARTLLAHPDFKFARLEWE